MMNRTRLWSCCFADGFAAGGEGSGLVAWLKRGISLLAETRGRRERSKSVRVTWPSARRSTFSGLRSRYATPDAWSSHSADTISA
ncbi:Os08g0504900, partial [Oryza sativa Japonica Group]